MEKTEFQKTNIRKLAREYKRSDRLKIIDHYSEGKNNCNNCGISDLRVLSIDHINGNGSTHREELRKKGTSLYRWIINNNYPSGFQILCMNCQFVKRTENNEQPYSKTRNIPENNSNQFLSINNEINSLRKEINAIKSKIALYDTKHGFKENVIMVRIPEDMLTPFQVMREVGITPASFAVMLRGIIPNVKINGSLYIKKSDVEELKKLMHKNKLQSEKEGV